MSDDIEAAPTPGSTTLWSPLPYRVLIWVLAAGLLVGWTFVVVDSRADFSTLEGLLFIGLVPVGVLVLAREARSRANASAEGVRIHSGLARSRFIRWAEVIAIVADPRVGGRVALVLSADDEPTAIGEDGWISTHPVPLLFTRTAWPTKAGRRRRLRHYCDQLAPFVPERVPILEI